jgi:hypothetical protein
VLRPRSRANPLAHGPLETRADAARAVGDLYEPLLPYISASGARVRLGSFGTVFDESTAELEGFARPLYGIVPLTVGGTAFPHWERIVAGLDAGTNPLSDDYWGPVSGDGDQRMVEQAALGVALAFCPEQAWEPLGSDAQHRLARWLLGIFEHDPSPNNWQFFRVLVALGLERVGVGFDSSKVSRSLDLLDSYRIGEHWYVDGTLETVDYYVPFAFHTYGLLYAAANALGLGDDARAEAYRDRSAAFASEFRDWFAPDGAAIPMGRSLTYRFAMASFWGALAWANVEPRLSWGEVKGLWMRHLRWWADKPISDRDGVLSVGFTYDNRRLAESYNSAGSPYWCMKAFAALAAPANHPFWTSGEEPLAPLPEPVTIRDAGWVVARGNDHAVALLARPTSPTDFPEESAAKYRKFAYSSVFGFSGDLPDLGGDVHTDSVLAFTDSEGNRRIRSGAEAGGLEAGMVWSTWHPWPDVRVDTVCWAIDSSWHGRLHRIRTDRALRSVEAGFAIATGGSREAGPDRAVLRAGGACSAMIGLEGDRVGAIRDLAVNANLIQPRTAVPALESGLSVGEHRLASIVFASPSENLPDDHPEIPTAAAVLIERVSARAVVGAIV